MKNALYEVYSDTISHERDLMGKTTITKNNDNNNSNNNKGKDSIKSTKWSYQ